MKKKKFIGVLTLLLISVFFASQANAGYYRDADLLTNTLYDSGGESGGNALASGKLEFINITGSSNLIVGPDKDNLAPSGGETAEINPNAQKYSQWGELGYNSWGQASAGAGHFKHEVSTNGAQFIVVRAWDNQDPATATHFGESIVFATKYDQGGTILQSEADVILASFSTKFTKTIPELPVLTTLDTDVTPG